MRNKLHLAATGILVTLLSGCSILPYEENFICNKGLNSGSCQSVSENYRDTFIDKNNIPLSLKQKEVLIDQLEEQGVINNSYIGKDEVLDWDQIIVLSKPRLEHILETYSFDNATTIRIQNIINNSSTSSVSNSNAKNKSVENAELFKYLRLRNESLNEENLKLKQTN